MHGFNIITLLLLISVLSQLISGSAIKAGKAGTTAAGVAKELVNLGIYGSRRGIIVKNDGQVGLRIWCASRDDSIDEKWLNNGESLVFIFNPKIIGGYTVFWCTLNYKEFWARFDVFGVDAKYGFDNDNDQTYEFDVRDDGVYYKEKKIRGLAGGKYGYTLWEHYDSDKNPHGASLAGHVDEGMCNNIPGFMERKTSDVTLCDHSCVILYSNLHCTGDTSRLQVNDGCSNFWLSFFNDKAKSVKGC